MNKKFLIFLNREFNPVVVLGIVTYHKDIPFPTEFGKPAVRCGGGWWELNKETGLLRLYSDSADFGKYDIEFAKEAFDKKNVYYFDENVYDDFKLKKLVCE